MSESDRYADDASESNVAPSSPGKSPVPPVSPDRVSLMDHSGGTHRILTAEDLRSPRRRRVGLPLALFIITCFSTFWAGTSGWSPTLDSMATVGPYGGMMMDMRRAVIRDWDQGLIYMLCVLAILLTHEMGHFIATECYRIPASLPYFIPFPVSPIGTMGAVIGMEGFKANRKQMFDIGIAGPLAGLVVAVPILWIGIQELDLAHQGTGTMAFGCPWLVRILIGYLQPEFRDVDRIWLSQLNPWFMAGWVGLLITGLNMMPVSQLDGGHVIYTLFRRRAHWIARAFLISAMAFVVLDDEAIMWTLMVVLVTLIGTDHPPTSDDRVALGPVRLLLGYASLLIPVLCFPLKAVIIP